jgi:cell division protein FtsI/penicillin-binding protein 2
MPRRIVWIKISFLLLFLAIVLRLGYWQLIKASDLTLQAQSQRRADHSLPSNRGEILYSDGFPMASNLPHYAFFVNPQLFQPSFAQGQALLSLLDATQSANITASQNSNLSWFGIGHVSESTKTAIEQLDLTGAGFDLEPIRYYPEGTSSAHLTGFLGKDQLGKPIGNYGLEGYYNFELTGKDGRLLQQQDVFGHPIVIADNAFVPAQDGKSLKTSIDRTLQYLAYQKLKAGIDKYQADSGSVTIMEPQTGRILAMVSLPGYDPQNYSQFSTENYKNPIVSSSYEPGSTFKTVIMAAGLDAKAISPSTICTACSSSVIISDYPIKTWNDEYHPNSTMSEIIQNSDNVGMVFVSRKLGHSKQLSYIKKFGFGSLSGIDLQEESSPPLRLDKDWTEIDYATASFGQGIAVTPIQMVRAVAAIANRGKLVQPRLVDEIIGKNYSKRTTSPPGDTIISAQTANQITAMMVDSVKFNKVGWQWPKQFTIAGKTGTAQVPISGHYDPDKTIGSFIGFAPAQNPRFVMLVVLNQTKTSPWGSRTAAPVWFEIATEIFRLYKITP